MLSFRRSGVVAVVAALVVSVFAFPASADAPLEITDSIIFEDLNPCDAPNTHEISLDFNIKVHEHRNNFVLKVHTVASTDDGFSGFGNETTVENKNNVSSTINFIQSNPETGQKFFVKGHLLVDLSAGEVKMDTFRMRCIRS